MNFGKRLFPNNRFSVFVFLVVKTIRKGRKIIEDLFSYTSLPSLWDFVWNPSWPYDHICRVSCWTTLTLEGFIMNVSISVWSKSRTRRSQTALWRPTVLVPSFATTVSFLIRFKFYIRIWKEETFPKMGNIVHSQVLIVSRAAFFSRIGRKKTSSASSLLMRKIMHH